MEQDSLNDWTNGLPAIGASFRYLQFSAADALRRMQGDTLALLGFGPSKAIIALLPPVRTGACGTMDRRIDPVLC
jgi:hypothetical protein